MPVTGGLVGEGPDFHLGERVLVVGQRTGVVRFCGKTSFAPGELRAYVLYVSLFFF